MKRFIVVVEIILFLLTNACKTEQKIALPKQNNTDSFPQAKEALTVQITGKHGGKLVTAMLSEPTTFNQLLFQDSDAQTFNQLMGAGLIKLNLATQNPEPALAKSWETSEDFLTWTFHLRKEIQWSDGHLFSADDVLFTMNLIQDPSMETPAKEALTVNGQQIQWNKIDGHTITAKLPSPFAPFLRQLDSAITPILAKHKWEKIYQDKKFQEAMQVNMDPADFVSLGPYTLKKYSLGQNLILKRNPYYWKKDQQGKRLPYLDEIIFLILGTQDQIQLKTENQEIDTWTNIRPEDIQKLQEKSNSLNMKIYNLGPSFDSEWILLNQNGGYQPKTHQPYLNPKKREWFSNLNFRKAISYAIDRDALVQNALYNQGIPNYGPETTGNRFWYNNKITKYPYNQDQALKLLEASGFKQNKDSIGKTILYDKKNNPVRFSLYTNAGNTTRHALCTLIIHDLAKIGISVDYSPLDFNTLVTKLTESFDFDAILLGSTHDDIDPCIGMNVWSSKGSLHFWWPSQKNPQTAWEKRIDELMNLQLTTFNMELRKKYYDEVQQIITDQQPIIFTTTQFIFVCAKKNLANLKPVISKHRILWNADEIFWEAQ